MTNEHDKSFPVPEPEEVIAAAETITAETAHSVTELPLIGVGVRLAARLGRTAQEMGAIVLNGDTRAFLQESAKHLN